MSTKLGCKDLEITKSEVVVKTQFILTKSVRDKKMFF